MAFNNTQLIEKIRTQTALIDGATGKIAKLNEGRSQTTVERCVFVAAYRNRNDLPWTGERARVASLTENLREKTGMKKSVSKKANEAARFLQFHAETKEFAGDPDALLEHLSTVIVSEKKVGISTQVELESYLGMGKSETDAERLAKFCFSMGLESAEAVIKVVESKGFTKAMANRVKKAQAKIDKAA